MATLLLHISGQVSAAVFRVDRTGKPVVEIELEHVPTGQTVRASHRYPDASHTSAFAARSLCARLRGQHVDFDAINPRFKAKRLECETSLIHTAHTGAERKDFQ